MKMMLMSAFVIFATASAACGPEGCEGVSLRLHEHKIKAIYRRNSKRKGGGERFLLPADVFCFLLFLAFLSFVCFVLPDLLKKNVCGLNT